MMKLFKYVGVALCLIVFARACFELGPVDLQIVTYYLSEFDFGVNELAGVLESFEKVTSPLSYLWSWDSELTVIENIWGVIRYSVAGPLNYLVDVVTCIFRLLAYFVLSIYNVARLFSYLFGFSFSS